MKVLYFHQHFSTPAGSTGIRSYEMARRLIADSHQVTMVCGSYKGGNTGLTQPFAHGRRRGMVDSIDIIELDLAYSNSDNFFRRSLTFLKFAIRSIHLALTEQYDVIFATTTPLTAGIPGIFARWLRRKPFVFEVRDLWPELPREMGIIKNKAVLALMAFLEWASYRSADRLIGLSPGIVDGIARLGVSRERIAMIPNGCDFDLFSRELPAWRPENIRSSDLLAVFAGTMGIANGLHAVLDAAEELQRRGRNDIHFLLIGQGKLKPQLEERALQAGLKNITFHAPVNKARLAGLMRGMDLGMQILANVPAFYYGTSPNKFFDYIASAKPVLNNYPGWLAEMIKESRCGFAVPADDPQAFATALEYAADNRDELRQMGERASDLGRQWFDRNILGMQFVSWLKGA